MFEMKSLVLWRKGREIASLECLIELGIMILSLLQEANISGWVKLFSLKNELSNRRPYQILFSSCFEISSRHRDYPCEPLLYLLLNFQIRKKP